MDDKYYCKVGELGYFVVVVDRGKCVVVVEDKVFVVFDYDFIKFSVVLSVIMLVDIFEFIEEGFFYRGQVYVGVKDLVFEFFLLLWYIVELKQILLDEELYFKFILCFYIDGGLDYWFIYLLVQLLLVCFFLSGDFDMLIVVRILFMGLWRNLFECIMLILNLVFQVVGLMRLEVLDKCEKKLCLVGGLGQFREVVKDFVMW